MADDKRARRRQLARELEDRVGDDPRLNAVALRHVLDRTAAPGLLAHRVFDDHEIFFDPRDDKIGFTLLQGREWQRRYIDRAIAVLSDRALIAPGGVYLDVGANIGCTVLYAMRSGLFASAVAFEPEPHNRSILERNLLANALSGRVRAIPAAVGEASGAMRLRLDPRNFGKHSLALGAAGQSDGIEVDVVRLDCALADAGVAADEISLMKIDTEGFEAQVLAGAGAILERATPLVIEISGFQSQASAAAASMKCLSGRYTTCVRLDREPWTVVVETLAEFTPECDQHELLVF